MWDELHAYSHKDLPSYSSFCGAQAKNARIPARNLCKVGGIGGVGGEELTYLCDFFFWVYKKKLFQAIESKRRIPRIYSSTIPNFEISSLLLRLVIISAAVSCIGE